MPLRPERLKQRRQFKGLGQPDLGRALGVSQQQIARWENGVNDPSGDAIARLARTLECTTDWLLGLVEQPTAHVRARELSADEQQLIDLYRQRQLPEMITRLVNELAGPKTQKDRVVDGLRQARVPPEDETPDS
jgi:transcriptional regulator with XRE-family HTH domain